MNTPGIHVSISEADDLEDTYESEILVRDVFLSLLQHPAQIVHRWNWKSATLGALMRASFYFLVFKASRESWIVTMTAVLVEFGFRFFTSGISGSLVQSFRKASPPWLAMLIVSISLPVFGHTVEYFTHYFQEAYFAEVFAAAENGARQRAFAVSVLVSVLSALFNIFMMRNGVLLVGAGEETKSLWGDIVRIPALIFEFIVFIPRQIALNTLSGRIHIAGLWFLSFGLAIGSILGVFRGKWSWAYATALGSWAILLALSVLTLIVIVIYRLRKNSSDPAGIAESKPPAS